jgi:hypothetical protein
MVLFDNLKAFLKALLLVFFPVLFAILSYSYTLRVSGYISAICGIIALGIEISLTIIKSYQNPILESIRLRSSEWVSVSLIVSDSLLLCVIPYIRRNVIAQPLFWMVLISLAGAIFLALLDFGLEGLLYYCKRQLTKKPRSASISFPWLSFYFLQTWQCRHLGSYASLAPIKTIGES